MKADTLTTFLRVAFWPSELELLRAQAAARDVTAEALAHRLVMEALEGGRVEVAEAGSGVLRPMGVTVRVTGKARDVRPSEPLSDTESEDE